MEMIRKDWFSLGRRALFSGGPQVNYSRGEDWTASKKLFCSSLFICSKLINYKKEMCGADERNSISPDPILKQLIINENKIGSGRRLTACPSTRFLHQLDDRLLTKT